MNLPISILGLSLSPLRIRQILQMATEKTNWSQPLMEIEVGASEALLLWLADWLAKRRPVADEQQQALLSFYTKQIKSCAALIENLPETDSGTTPTVLLSILDAKLAAMSGEDSSYLDLRTGDTVKTITRLPVEITSINLVALFFQRRQIAERAKCQLTKPT